MHVAFTVDVANIDETPVPGHTQEQTASHLALAKARAVAARQPDALVIGADQVAELDGRFIGKPGTHDAALEQLLAMQGRTVRFHSGIAMVDSRDGGFRQLSVPTDVRFRTLSRDALDTYLRIDLPYDCAGSAKIESLGICLVESVHSADPSALIGLPLIALTSLLAAFGVQLPLPA
jgi:septum formation protein